MKSRCIDDLKEKWSIILNFQKITRVIPDLRAYATASSTSCISTIRPIPGYSRALYTGWY